MQPISRFLANLLATLFLLPSLALAHHGWSWTTGGNIQLSGVIVESRLGNPHGELVIGVEDERWTVEVGQPWRNKRAGLSDAQLAPGNEIRVEGEPSADIEERLLKVERLWIDGKKYELYPRRN